MYGTISAVVKKAGYPDAVESTLSPLPKNTRRGETGLRPVGPYTCQAPAVDSLDAKPASDRIGYWLVY
jgi:hypothetical protein